MLAWQTTRLLSSSRADEYTVHVRPELVVEVAFNDVQAARSTRRAGAAVARVKRYRPDKGRRRRTRWRRSRLSIAGSRARAQGGGALGPSRPGPGISVAHNTQAAECQKPEGPADAG